MFSSHADFRYCNSNFSTPDVCATTLTKSFDGNTKFELNPGKAKDIFVEYHFKKKF